MTLDLLVAGVISQDTSLHVPFIPAADSECFALSIHDAHGGAAANVAAFAAFYGGLSVGLVARVGDDLLGEALLSRLSEYHVNLDGTIRTLGMSSTRIFTILPPNGSRSYIINLGAHNALSRRDIPADYISAARAFYLAPCSPEIHADLLDFAFTKRCTIYFNPGTVYIEQAERDRLFSLVAKSDFLFLNEMEAITYSGKNSIEEAGKFFIEIGSAYAIITASNRGSFVFSANREQPINVPSKIIKAVNTIGAGDAFAAGFVSEHLKTGDIISAASSGALYGAYAITQTELRKASPSPDAMMRFAAANP